MTKCLCSVEKRCPIHGYHNPKEPVKDVLPLNSNEREAVRLIQFGENVIKVRRTCTTLRVYPPTAPYEVPFHVFRSKVGNRYCIIRAIKQQ